MPHHARTLATPRLLELIQEAAAGSERDHEGWLVEPAGWSEAYAEAAAAAKRSRWTKKGLVAKGRRAAGAGEGATPGLEAGDVELARLWGLRPKGAWGSGHLAFDGSEEGCSEEDHSDEGGEAGAGSGEDGNGEGDASLGEGGARPSVNAGAPRHPAALSSSQAWTHLSRASCFVGMHPDGATEWAIDAAIALGVPWAVVPCCVYSAYRRASGRADGTTSFEEFVELLAGKDPRSRITRLPFEGRNTLVAGPGSGGWRTPEGETSA